MGAGGRPARGEPGWTGPGWWRRVGCEAGPNRSRTAESYGLFSPGTSAAGVPGGQVSLALGLRWPRPGWGSRESLLFVAGASPGGRQVIRCNSRAGRRGFACLREFTGSPPHASPLGRAEGSWCFMRVRLGGGIVRALPQAVRARVVVPFQ